MVPGLRSEGARSPVYNSEDEEFSIEMHHGGFFMGNGVNRAYVDGRVSWFDHYHQDIVDAIDLDDVAIIGSDPLRTAVKPNISEEEEEIKFSFKSFRADVDMETPEFKVSMMFADAVELRKAIDQYTIKNRVAIKKTRNTKIRIEAKCAEGCPWMLSASMDNRVKCLVVREYIEKHTCSKQWEIKAVTAKYLAKRYIEEFRDNDKMTLMSFAKKIQKELHLTPSRHKLSRARRMAMRAIYGDEISQ
ncbi:hypothetical protein OsI_32520 [Oryza sativa Indica Group]|uniref:Transposase MuDR plant domain-containing protein n=1 Tax=Oryza sativa subsp. indica TaxID=39946 RepID=B8BFJ7_ORYSI|nr:hypothetical protein OsI_32520 [Oryza sativa Indica Group]